MKRSIAYIIIPAREGKPASFIGGPAGHSIPVGYKIADGDDVPPKYTKET